MGQGGPEAYSTGRGFDFKDGGYADKSGWTSGHQMAKITLDRVAKLFSRTDTINNLTGFFRLFLVIPRRTGIKRRYLGTIISK